MTMQTVAHAGENTKAILGTEQPMVAAEFESSTVTDPDHRTRR